MRKQFNHAQNLERTILHETWNLIKFFCSRCLDPMHFLVSVLTALILLGCGIPEPLLERIKESGELVVITRNSPTTYYEDRDGYKGLEYELVQLFAAELGVKAKFVVPDALDDILPAIARGDAHFAAAGLTVTPTREILVRFGPAYQKITQQLVYRRGSKRPKKITDTIGGSLEVVAGSSHEEELRRLKVKHPDLRWVARAGVEPEELLRLVKEQVIDYTVADSNELALNRRFHPELRPAFDLTKPQPLAWAFPHAEDTSLFKAAKKFFGKLRKNGTLEQLIERYYGHTDRLNFVDKRTFRRHIAMRLPDLVDHFKEAAEVTGIEWELLAAIGYQESHWNPKAVSPTGVKGIMMLTQATASQLEIEDREDPRTSIIGGARYLRIVEEKIPDRIPEPDRLWLTLAGYNVGFGHLEDARILTQRLGGDPDKWADVKKSLPLLSDRKYHTTVKHGYARGTEPVNYVDNVRSYYDLLKWENGQARTDGEAPSPTPVLNTPAAL